MNKSVLAKSNLIPMTLQNIAKSNLFYKVGKFNSISEKIKNNCKNKVENIYFFT